MAGSNPAESRATPSHQHQPYGWHPLAKLPGTPCPGTVSCQQDPSPETRRGGRVPSAGCRGCPGPFAVPGARLRTGFSGFGCCCYFRTSETCRKRNPEALSPAEMFALTQFGRLQSKSHVALPPEPGSSAATRSCFCPTGGHAPRLYPHISEGQERLRHHVPAEGRYLAGSTPPRSPSASLDALQTSARRFSSRRAVGHPPTSKPGPRGTK